MLRWLTGIVAALALWCPAFDPALAGKLKPGDVFRDCDGCPEMVVIPPGTFSMGSPASEERRNANESPRHEVTIKAMFAAGKFEVTRGEYAAFVEATGHNSGSSCSTLENGAAADREGRSFKSPGFEQTDEHPVVCVSWEDAQAYVKWLSEKTGAGYRLLSEAEWEYAGRAGTTTPYSTGPAITGEQANFNGSLSRTAGVGGFAANGFGLHDMHGNVWEWAADCYRDSYRGAPSDGTAWTTGACEYRVRRGGGWFDFPENLRAAVRDGLQPGHRVGNLGFRVARTL